MSPRPRRWRLLVAALATATAASVAPLTLAAPATAADPTPVTVTGLQTNGRTEPLGIPGEPPMLGWRGESTGRDVVQSAYQVRVATSEDDLGSAPLWDTGKVVSDRQADVTYAGPALESQARYVWQVRTWDGADQASAWSEPASFETGLLDSADWGDAAWIGAPAGTELNRWTDYTVTFDFSIDNLLFGTYLRAPNLSNGYMWQVSVADGTPRLRPHKKVNGNFSLLDNKDISAFVSTQELLTGQHTMSVTFDGPTITTTLDGDVIDTRNDASFDRGFVGFRTDQATQGTEAQTVHDVRVVAKNGTVLLDTDFATEGNPFSGGTVVDGALRYSGRQDALWVSPDEHLPLLRTDFSTAAGKTVERARVYATARGIYELELNGEKVGDQHLAPGWTDYLARFQHQTYDVTDQVRTGDNAFGAMLAKGWWAGKVGMWGPGVYGTQTSLLARLRIDYTDGTSEWVDTDTGWSTSPGPWTFTDNIDGETYDARRAKAGWEQPGYDDSGWAAAVVRPAPAAPVVPQPDEPVRTTEELDTVVRTEPSPGAWVYDLGQNMVGVARMTLTGQAGQTVRIRYGEELNPDGTLYTANLRAAKVTDHYTFAADGTVTYEPTFTQHGFRYVEIVGTATPPAATDVTGVVWGSDLAPTGRLETSDPMLNQLASNISWGQRGNFLSIPTDTPARDERLGWTGDINVFAPTASYLTDTRAFLAKWLTDLRDEARPNGDMPGIAPVPPGNDLGTGLGWSDAIVTVPYAVWRAHGDTAILRQNYAAMRTFVEFVRTGAGEDLIDSARGHWDDWLNLDDPTPTSVLGTAYYAENTRMLSEMAAALGEDADAAEYAELSDDVRVAFTEQLVAADGTVSGNSQTAYAMALGMDLVTDAALREKVAARFVAKLASRNNHLSTGFLGTPWLLPALSSIGREDLAWTMLTHKDFPSWGYEVENGATTMWERWDSIKPDGTFGDVGMNSFNHYAYGAVGDWMYRNIGAIAPLDPGYKKIRVAPVPGGGVTSGAGEFRSVYGTIATDWQLDGGDLALAVDVPVNTTAEVVLPADNAWAVTEGGALLDGVEGVHDVVDGDGTVTITIGSGSYDFAVTAANEALGGVLDLLVDLRDHVDGLAAEGDLAGGDADELDGRLVATHDDVTAALLATLDDDDAVVADELRSALGRIREARTWLAGSSVDAPVRGSLDRRLSEIETALTRSTATALGVSISLPPVVGAVLPGTTAQGAVTVTNDGDTAVTVSAGSVTVAGWEPVTLEPVTVAAGASAQLPVALAVPQDADPASYDAGLSLSLTIGDEDYELSDTSADWVTVTSGLVVGAVTGALDAGDPAEHATLSVPVTNEGSRPVRARVVATLPAGWRSVPSDEVVVPAGGSVTATVPVVVGLDRVGGPTAVSVAVVRGGATLATKDASVSFPVTAPPTAAVVDHVDFGNGASETAHALMAAPNSGTNVEAGLTRRYAHSSHPGSWYSVLLDVPAGEPFVLRSIETFDMPRTKKYHVWIDDVLEQTQVVPRSEPGVGTKVHDILVDTPAALAAAADGEVRVKFEFPTDASGFFDPSLADTWVIAVPDDEQAPDVTAAVTAGVAGDGGWHRSDVEVTVTAADNRDAAPAVQTGESAGWQDYTGPVAVTGEGKHTLSYRATDASGNTSGTRTLPVWIDATAPTTQVAVKRGTGVDSSDRATLTFTASDALSGVAATSYRIDGGPWQQVGAAPVVVEGYGDHAVELTSTDVAGNAEVVRQTTISLADVETVAAVTLPQVGGATRIGGTLTSTTGTWNTKGLTYARQWLRNGVAIAGATGETYRVVAADAGTRLSVRVTATKDGLAPGAATSAPTAPVAKAASTTRSTVSKGKVKAGKKVKVTATVTAVGVPVTGKVQVVVDGKVVRTLVLRSGKASTKVKIRKGTHSVVVRYLGSASVAASAAPVRKVRGT
ncbi:family 78 glycoside hydrolase catalytic domain [Nocardioides sp. SYSU D00038]|uniref:family 78 glycoside hydrolase catalytic domain n=1 Tax=Nocardioides sp. SYSU D00038 TaxID=2812554 RepID=UPI001967CF33|nr:family 78 glycoside hydrolase catalytic domain [Nocardioides sp. SYSU D00038]